MNKTQQAHAEGRLSRQSIALWLADKLSDPECPFTADRWRTIALSRTGPRMVHKPLIGSSAFVAKINRTLYFTDRGVSGQILGDTRKPSRGW
jgi:hypothetical protein